MRIAVELELPADPDDVLPWVESLDTYPTWTTLVHRVAVDASGSEPAWIVELRARIGPLARSKRLRMVRAATGTDGHLRFERAEVDGRDHGHWEFDVRCTSTGVPGSPRSRLAVVLAYDGANWAGGIVERTLQDEIERSKARLTELVSAGRLPGPTP